MKGEETNKDAVSEEIGSGKGHESHTIVHPYNEQDDWPHI